MAIETQLPLLVTEIQLSLNLSPEVEEALDRASANMRVPDLTADSTPEVIPPQQPPETNPSLPDQT
jgi:hypothetical protein